MTALRIFAKMVVVELERIEDMIGKAFIEIDPDVEDFLVDAENYGQTEAERLVEYLLGEDGFDVDPEDER